jgi:hypothetical protein
MFLACSLPASLSDRLLLWQSPLSYAASVGRKRWQRGCAVALSLAVASAGCSTSATIKKFDDYEIEGQIIDGSRGSITILDADHRERQIPRGQIKQISHPGGPAAVIGGILLAYGIYNIAVGLPHCQARGAAFCLGVFSPATIGAGMEIWSLVVNHRSRQAAEGRGLHLNRPLDVNAPGIEPSRVPNMREPTPDSPRWSDPQSEPVIEPAPSPDPAPRPARPSGGAPAGPPAGPAPQQPDGEEG